jgi:hypothetical protein
MPKGQRLHLLLKKNRQADLVTIDLQTGQTSSEFACPILAQFIEPEYSSLRGTAFFGPNYRALVQLCVKDSII